MGGEAGLLGVVLALVTRTDNIPEHVGPDQLAYEAVTADLSGSYCCDRILTNWG